MLKALATSPFSRIKRNRFISPLSVKTHQNINLNKILLDEKFLYYFYILPSEFYYNFYTRINFAIFFHTMFTFFFSKFFPEFYYFFTAF